MKVRRQQIMSKDIVSIVKQIAVNLGDYDKMLHRVTDQSNIRVWNGISYPAWEPATLSHGIPGICLLYGKLMECFPEEEIWANLAHKYLGYLVKEINSMGIRTLSMFSGAAGIGLAVASVSNNFTNYGKLLNSINSYILSYYSSIYNINTNKIGVSSVYYDVIEGLTGVLSYCSIFYNHEKFRRVLLDGLSKLVSLTDDIMVDGKNVPAWFISSDNQFSEVEKALYPYGNFNTSFSHGITGPLAFLADMKSKGIVVEGQEGAINKIMQFLFDYRQSDGKRDFWKGQIDFREFINGKLSNENIVRRDAWCYGNPGICYAILKAGKAMKKSEWTNYALDNIKKTMTDIKGVFSPTFCHGFAGLYQILNSLEIIMKEGAFADEKKKLLDKIMGYYDPFYPYGFKNIEVGDDQGDIRAFEYIGALDGTVGVCLALLDGEFGGESLWKKAFVLA